MLCCGSSCPQIARLVLCSWLRRTLNNAAGDVPKGLFLEKPSPLSFAKAIKNTAELDGMHEAHLRDSVALAETLHHLEQEVSIALPHAIHLMPGT